MMPIEWNALLTTYRNRAGHWPERIYLHPLDYLREQDRHRDKLIALVAPDTEADALLWGVPVQVTPLVPEAAPLLWPPVGLAAAVRQHAEEEASRDTRWYPLFPISPLLWAFGTGQGDVIAATGPYWPDPPFQTQAVPRKTTAWRYIVPPPPQPVTTLREPPSPWVDLDIRTTTLHRWAWAEEQQVTANWFVGYAPEIRTYLVWECAAYA